MSNTSIAQDAAKVLLAVVPALNPYGTAINVAFEVVAATAPAIYTEISSLIDRIKNGGEPTSEDIAKLRGLIAALKNPDSYFEASAQPVGPEPQPAI